jgi:MscS family membrane protein
MNDQILSAVCASRYCFAGTRRFSRGLLSALLLLLISTDAGARHPLAPFDTSSPRATLESYFDLSDEVFRRWSEYGDSPSRATQDALERVGSKSLRLLNLSEIPPAARREVGPEAASLLWEVMFRVKLPDLQDVPDFSVVMESDEDTEQLTHWRIPDTEITIARVEDGPRAGEFLFSPDTVERVRDFYEVVRDLPYERPVPIKDMHRKIQLLTGWMIPPAWIEALPDWANTSILGLVLWKWLVVVTLLGLASAVVIVVFRWGRRAPWDGSLGSYLRRLGTPLSILVVTPLLRFLFQMQINLTGSAAEAPDYLIEVAYGVAVVWLVWLTASWLAEALIATPLISPNSLDANLIRLAARTTGILASMVLLFQVAHAVGIPVYGLVAGAGVGGITVALAAKSTLENFLGSLNIYADRPIRVGDLCRYGEDASADWQRIGHIEEIGLRSTRIRGLDRTVTTIPNADFSNMHIVNLTKRDLMLLSTTLCLRYETTQDQLRFVLADLRELMHAHPMTLHTANDPIRVRFAGFGESSLDVAIRVYIKTSDVDEFLAIKEDILLRVMQVVEQAGTGFAFPSRTLYHSRESGLDDARRQDAEKQVRAWASAQTLPFPEFSEDYRCKITDTLDYPPEGSPEADRG